ncbi:unnamed protein product [Arabidopsis halleri]
MNSNSVGVFHEREIDGKPFHIYTLSSQTDTTTTNPSSSGEIAINGDDDLSLQPLFLCPSLRLRLQRESNSVSEFLPYNISPHFPSITSVDQQVQHLLDSDSHDHDDDQICKLPVVPLYWKRT